MKYFLIILCFIATDLFAENQYIVDMISVYNANQARFHQQYRGKEIQGTGQVENVKADFLGTGSIFMIHLNVNGSTLQCTTENKNAAASLNKGEGVKFQGSIYDIILGVPILKDCVFVKPKLTNAENKNDSYNEYIRYSKLSETITALTEALGGHRFEDYPAEIYKGKPVPPEYMERDSKGYFTISGFGKKLYWEIGANFGGKYFITTGGCGTGCRWFSMDDLTNGKPIDAIRMFQGDENNFKKDGFQYVIDMHHKPSSNLLIVQYQLMNTPEKISDCRERSFVFRDNKFVPIDKTYYSCSEIPSKLDDSWEGD